MFTLFGIAFTTPWLLLGLIALPILWILLRAVPPAPIRRLFPGVALLLGLSDDETQTDRTPWWLLLLRILAIAALIIGFAGPVLNPRDETPSEGPLLILADASWSSARDWTNRRDRIESALSDASREGRTVAFVQLTDIPTGDLPFQAAESWRTRLPGLDPKPWEPDNEDIAEWVGDLTGSFETLWFSDGLDRASRDPTLQALRSHGPVRVFESPRPVLGLRPPEFAEGLIGVTAIRATAGPQLNIDVVARGLDPAGIERDLAKVGAEFAQGSAVAEVDLSLPPELRNRVSRFVIDGVRSAGAVTLTDDALKRREVALVSARNDREALELLSPTHYLTQALAPTADLIDGSIGDIILANPDAIILVDVATLAEADADLITGWVESGGLLVRFAGPRLAASDVSRDEEDPLMPVRLRAGGRRVGGAMSWGEPKALRAFADTSPFSGLVIPDDARVSAQVMAQPDPALSERVIAALTDGTPLVTRKNFGQGQIVLFHVTANAEWSNLPLSGLFVQMLERLAVSTRPARPDLAELEGTTWVPSEVLNAFGEIKDADTLAGIDGALLAEGQVSNALPPGLYTGDDRRLALNVVAPDRTLAVAQWPADVPVEGLTVSRERQLKGMLLTAALAMLAIDILASLWLSGRLWRVRSGVVAGLALIMLGTFSTESLAQSDALAVEATSDVVLAYVTTGDSRLDSVSLAGLRGLGDVLFARTSVEPAEPMAIDLETMELSFFPVLYWPIGPDQPIPSTDAYSKLNRYLRAGGMILFDTRDADIAGFGTASPNGRKLQQIARPLDIPPLEPIPADHVLTRTFYLLQDFPGRHLSRDVWVEAAPPDAELVEGMPFRNLNDNVTPVVIGGNDWATAWAVDDAGNWMFPVGRGLAGERQREIAYRFGINLVMHVLTGNYKSDQVHVPALLDRLGQ